MNKLNKILKAIQLFFGMPSVVNLITNSDIAWEKYNSKRKINPLPMVALSNFVAINDKNTVQLSYLGGSSLATDLLLIQNVCKKFENCHYFEIGTWRGESVINAAKFATNCYTFNLSSEEIKKMGMKEKYANLHGFFSKSNAKIQHLFGNTLDFEFDKLDKKFDVIFIDGNHTYPYVKNDTEKVFKNLVHEKSIVIWHDYAYEPEQYRPEVLAGIMEGIPQNRRENVYHVSNTMCAIYTPFKMEVILDDVPLTPTHIFENQISLSKIEKGF